jgi:hypothetical protein
MSGETRLSPERCQQSYLEMWKCLPLGPNGKGVELQAALSGCLTEGKITALRPLLLASLPLVVDLSIPLPSGDTGPQSGSVIRAVPNAFFILEYCLLDGIRNLVLESVV